MGRKAANTGAFSIALGKQIRHAMVEKNNMSQKELVEKTGLSDQTIRRTIRGERSPGVEELNIIAEALDCDVLELIGKSLEEAKRAEQD